jgi:hypothetical protein
MRHPTVIERKRPSGMLSCTQCGAEAKAACSCNAAYMPAAEKLAEKLEKDRQRARRAYEKKKDEQNQDSSHVRKDEDHWRAKARQLGFSVREHRDGTFTLTGRDDEKFSAPNVEVIEIVLVARATDQLALQAVAQTDKLYEQLTTLLKENPQSTPQAWANLSVSLADCAEAFKRMSQAAMEKGAKHD